MHSSNKPSAHESLAYDTVAAMIADQIRDPYGTHEVARDVELRRILGNTVVTADQVLPTSPEAEALSFDQTHGLETVSEKANRQEKEAGINSKLVKSLMTLLPEAHYDLRLSGLRRSKVSVETPRSDDPYLQAAAHESLIWVHADGAYLPTVCIGENQGTNGKTTLLLATLRATFDSTLKWARWSTIPTDLSGGPRIPIRDSGVVGYAGGKLLKVSVKSGPRREFMDSMASRIHGRALEYTSKQAPTSFKKDDADYTLSVANNSFEEFYLQPSALNNEMAEKFEVASHLASLANIFKVSDAYSKMCEEIAQKANKK